MSKPWTELEFVAVDVETTSFIVQKARICEVAATIIQNGEVTSHTFETLVNPRVPIEIEAQEVHGISDADVATAPEFVQIRAGLREYLHNRIIIAHNADYDIGRLQRVMPYHDFGLVLDTIVLRKYCRINQSYRKLQTLVEKLNLVPAIHSTYRASDTVKPHRAGYDANAAAHLFVRFVRDDFASATLSDLERMCGRRYS